MTKLWIILLLAIVILDLLVETDADYGCPTRTSICIRACRAKNYTTGYCRGSQCRCRRPVCPSSVSLCRLYCYRKGYRYGYCSGTRCRCIWRACPMTSFYCHISCRWDKRYSGGRCIGTRCWCYRRTG